MKKEEYQHKLESQGDAAADAAHHSFSIGAMTAEERDIIKEDVATAVALGRDNANQEYKDVCDKNGLDNLT